MRRAPRSAPRPHRAGPGRLHATAYREKGAGRERLRFLNVSRVRAVGPGADGGLDVAVEFLPTGERQVLAADALVLAVAVFAGRPRDAGSRVAAEFHDWAPELAALIADGETTLVPRTVTPCRSKTAGTASPA